MPATIRAARFVVGAVRQADFPADGRPEIAFSGRSNVGKSSLINCLTRRRNLARTSSTPGKTQQLNYYLIDDRLYFVDLPGYGYVRGGAGLRQRLGELTEGYLSAREPLRAVVQLLDARHGPTELDWMMIEWLRDTGKPHLLVFTKADKLSSSKLQRQLKSLEGDGRLTGASYAPFSAANGLGRDDVLDWVMAAAQSSSSEQEG